VDGQEHRAGWPGRDRCGMPIWICDGSVEALPGLTPILAAPHAIHLDARPQLQRLGRIDGDVRDARCAHIRAFGGNVDGQLLPTRAIVVASEDSGYGGCAGADEHHTLVGWMKRHPPYMLLADGTAEPGPVSAGILASQDAAVGASPEHVWSRRATDQRPHNCIRVKAHLGSDATPVFAVL